MKVTLIRPYNKFSYSVTPPLGLGYLASVLKVKGGHEVSLYEAARGSLSGMDSLVDFLKEKTPGVVGVQVYSMDLPVVKEYLRTIKEWNPETVTILGGPHPSSIPVETFEYFGSDLDFLLCGEGEYGFLNFVNRIEEGASDFSGVRGLAWPGEDGAIVRNKTELIEELDELPWPAWELMAPDSYGHAPLGGVSKNFPVAPIIVSRGCPYICTFCAAKTVYGDGFRYRSIDDVIEEIRFLKKDFAVKEIMIQDDNITFKKDVIMEFCEKIAPLEIEWNCLNGIRLNSLDGEIVRAMKGAGCHAVAVGIESGSQKILHDMNKKLKIETIREKIGLLSENGMKVTGQFIIGYPTETREDVLKTIRFAKELPIQLAAFASFMPLPGSKIYDDLLAEGRLNGVDYGDMSYYNIVESFSPHMTKEELDKLLKKAIREFFLRPSVILYTIKSVGSLSNFFELLKRFLKNYG